MDIPHLIKAILQQAHSQHQLKWKEIQNISTKIRNETRLSISQYLSNIVLEVLARAIRQLKKVKEIQTGKEKLKVSLFADDMILYTSRPRKFHQETPTADKNFQQGS